MGHVPRKRHLNTALVLHLMAAAGIDNIAALAKEVQRERSYISRIVSAERPVPPSLLIAIGEQLGVNPASLVANDSLDAEIRSDAEAETAA